LGLPDAVVAAAEAALPSGSAELAEALRRLEAERADLRAQAAAALERERLAAQREREGAAALEHTAPEWRPSAATCASRALN